MAKNGDARREITAAGNRGGGVLYSIEPGKRSVGRPPGARNRTTNILKEAILLAAETTGMPEVRRNDAGEIVEVLETGERGLVGYLIHIALHEPLLPEDSIGYDFGFEQPLF